MVRSYGDGAAEVQGKSNAKCGSHGPTACNHHGNALPGPLARGGACGKGLLQTLMDMVPVGTCDTAEQYPRWHLLWQIQAVIQKI